MRPPPQMVLWACLALFPTRLVFGQSVVLNEIMFHPLQPQFGSEPVGEEFIELFNGASTNVNLNGWHFSKGISYTFGNVTLAAGAYLVVSPNTNAFRTRYAAVNNVVGNWSGTLGNNGETIELLDGAGNVIDSVAYAAEGDWALHLRGQNDLNHRGWTWSSEADGFGKSMELRNPNLFRGSGQNWGASVSAGGTPGRVNSLFTNNVAPLILHLSHSPVVPRSTDAVTINAQIVDESTSGLNVTLFWRVDATSPPPFTAQPMFDDGTHGDGLGGDGFYGAQLPPQPNNTVVEFYVQAVDADGRTNTWPAVVLPALDGAGPTGQVANAL
ncbi:MAG TPA: lamin tail domain-containing protein, partial [Candidatus Binatia bacterium]|nr:lamin tail domain-containing protein [Candidatus Binatia bacterium]